MIIVLRKKFFFASIAITVIFIGMILSACGKSNPNVPTNNQANQTGQTKTELTTVEKVAGYEGADRTQFLLEGAKKEGTLTIYASAAAIDLEKISGDFQKKYGIKVDIWRAGQNEVRSRIINEATAKINTFDVVHTTGKEMEAIYREHLLQKVNSPYFKDLISEAVFPHQEWTGTFISVFVQAYNTKKLKKEDLPKTYQDLLDPKWKNQLGVEATDYEWLMGVAKVMGEEKGIQFFRDLVKNNGVTARKGHTVLNNAVIVGEVPIGLTQYHYIPAQSKDEGAPIDWFAIDPAIAQISGVGMSKKAPHPYTAMLFYDYLITDGQKILAELKYIPTNKTIDSPFRNIKFIVSNSAEFLDENKKWNDLFDDIFLKQK